LELTGRTPWSLCWETRAATLRLFETAAEGNAVVVAELLQEQGIEVSVSALSR
jgi:hypothetical protein